MLSQTVHTMLDYEAHGPISPLVRTQITADAMQSTIDLTKYSHVQWQIFASVSFSCQHSLSYRQLMLAVLVWQRHLAILLCKMSQKPSYRCSTLYYHYGHRAVEFNAARHDITLGLHNLGIMTAVYTYPFEGKSYILLFIVVLLPYRLCHALSCNTSINTWTIHDLQAVILLVPRPFTTCRAMQWQVPQSHQLFTHHNSQRAMEELQASGLGMVHDTGQNQIAYHKRGEQEWSEVCATQIFLG